ncbi:hypothetical protein IE077_002286 [Cardiosporidium cionae]|uniref:Uncharacterized protein n=1 Tax=Cardiosporidium cionae TaxID=476202 RepID=A0ABQ7JFW6_9APIC|nr:hypothetical protein IE077_002286 [Cardiosporidium cionae]|eukprot:KAF8822873.1 hypothetical protein IE077_002286 [Cardiosporidium cionae]
MATTSRVESECTSPLAAVSSSARRIEKFNATRKSHFLMGNSSPETLPVENGCLTRQSSKEGVSTLLPAEISEPLPDFLSEALPGFFPEFIFPPNSVGNLSELKEHSGEREAETLEEASVSSVITAGEELPNVSTLLQRRSPRAMLSSSSAKMEENLSLTTRDRKRGSEAFLLYHSPSLSSLSSHRSLSSSSSVPSAIEARYTLSEPKSIESSPSEEEERILHKYTSMNRNLVEKRALLTLIIEKFQKENQALSARLLHKKKEKQPRGKESKEGRFSSSSRGNSHPKRQIVFLPNLCPSEEAISFPLHLLNFYVFSEHDCVLSLEGSDALEFSFKEGVTHLLLDDKKEATAICATLNRNRYRKHPLKAMLNRNMVDEEVVHRQISREMSTKNDPSTHKRFVSHSPSHSKEISCQISPPLSSSSDEPLSWQEKALKLHKQGKCIPCKRLLRRLECFADRNGCDLCHHADHDPMFNKPIEETQDDSINFLEKEDFLEILEEMPTLKKQDAPSKTKSETHDASFDSYEEQQKYALERHLKGWCQPCKHYFATNADCKNALKGESCLSCHNEDHRKDMPTFLLESEISAASKKLRRKKRLAGQIEEEEVSYPSTIPPINHPKIYKVEYPPSSEIQMRESFNSSDTFGDIYSSYPPHYDIHGTSYTDSSFQQHLNPYSGSTPMQWPPPTIHTVSSPQAGEPQILHPKHHSSFEDPSTSPSKRPSLSFSSIRKSHRYPPFSLFTANGEPVGPSILRVSQAATMDASTSSTMDSIASLPLSLPSFSSSTLPSTPLLSSSSTTPPSSSPSLQQPPFPTWAPSPSHDVAPTTAPSTYPPPFPSVSTPMGGFTYPPTASPPFGAPFSPIEEGRKLASGPAVPYSPFPRLETMAPSPLSRGNESMAPGLHTPHEGPSPHFEENPSCLPLSAASSTGPRGPSPSLHLRPAASHPHDGPSPRVSTFSYSNPPDSQGAQTPPPSEMPTRLSYSRVSPFAYASKGGYFPPRRPTVPVHMPLRSPPRYASLSASLVAASGTLSPSAAPYTPQHFDSTPTFSSPPFRPAFPNPARSPLYPSRPPLYHPLVGEGSEEEGHLPSFYQPRRGPPFLPRGGY